MGKASGAWGRVRGSQDENQVVDGGNKLWVRECAMAEAERITARQRAILTAIVESYIETGQPVGSGTIAGTIARVRAGGGHGATGLSSATV